MSYRFSTSRMSNQCDFVCIYFLVKRTCFWCIPFVPLSQVFQQNPSASVVFFFQTIADHIRPRTVDEILIHRSQNHSSWSQQFSQIFVSRIWIILHAVISVHYQNQWKRSITFRIPNLSIQRQRFGIKSPVSCAPPSTNSFPIVKKCNTIYRICLDVYLGSKMGSVFVFSTSIRQGFHFKSSFFRRRF